MSLYKNERTHRGEHLHEHEDRYGGDASISQETPKILATNQS
jgi:hypothetical protein